MSINCKKKKERKQWYINLKKKMHKQDWQVSEIKVFWLVKLVVIIKSELKIHLTLQ